MPRSNTTGGKQHKKGKKKRTINDNTEKQLKVAENNQVYACVLKKAGGSRLMLSCSDNKERSGIIPGKFFKKVWMCEGDIVLCELDLGNDDSQCYIIHKYTVRDANILKTMGKIEFDVMSEFDAPINNVESGSGGEDDSDEIIFGNLNKVSVDKHGIKDFSNSNDSSESSSFELNNATISKGKTKEWDNAIINLADL